ncbi:MAG: 1,4-alpha-glucan branching enzyme, partial [Stenotrophomonas sp.]|nr:1,4-alpha-glucan branching enzyme [Stenotrophomonas sp.]
MDGEPVASPAVVREPEASAMIDAIPEPLLALSRGEPVDPFAWLGVHAEGNGGHVLRVLLPGARAVWAKLPGQAAEQPLAATAVDGLYQAEVPGPGRAALRISWAEGEQRVEDPYGFWPLLADDVLAGIRDGDGEAMRALGAHTVKRTPSTPSTC